VSVKLWWWNCFWLCTVNISLKHLMPFPQDIRLHLLKICSATKYSDLKLTFPSTLKSTESHTVTAPIRGCTYGLKSQNWQLTSIHELIFCSALCCHPLLMLMDICTRCAACRHTTVPISHNEGHTIAHVTYVLIFHPVEVSRLSWPLARWAPCSLPLAVSTRWVSNWNW